MILPHVYNTKCSEFGEARTKKACAFDYIQNPPYDFEIAVFLSSLFFIKTSKS